MKLLEVYTPEIDIYVRYKVMEPSEVDHFVANQGDLSQEDYIRAVLDAIVFNLKSDVSEKLRDIPKTKARDVLDNIYNGCIMLNPGLDVDRWLAISSQTKEASTSKSAKTTKKSTSTQTKSKRSRSRKITRARFLGLEDHLKSRVIGQDEAIDAVVSALKRSITGLGDEGRPMGVFLFAGASGVGKTHLAKELHKYLFGDHEIVRVDCGEYQHKHENQKLLGAPPGYVGHEEGGALANSMLDNPNTVVLLDEVEKAHPDLWNTFLRVFDEGVLTDSSGQEIPFDNAIIIMTTNIGNREVIQTMAESMGFSSKARGENQLPDRRDVVRYTTGAIRKNFRPEFLNRIDRTVVFNHLTSEDHKKIALLELELVEQKLSKNGINFTFDDTVLNALVDDGISPIKGVRGLATIRRDKIEDAISDVLIKSARWTRGTVLRMTHDPEEGYQIDVEKPKRKAKTAK